MLTPEITAETWVISDTHFAHLNIIRYCQRPSDCDARMFSNWASMVKPKDTILHLGDLWFPRQETLEAYRRKIAKLPGRKYLLKGNHDKTRWQPLIESLGFTWLGPDLRYITIKGFRVGFSHYPLLKREVKCDLLIHGHIHNNGYDPKFTGDPLRKVNVSVELTDYKPVRLGSLLKRGSAKQ